jgi:hypothetical protein
MISAVAGESQHGALLVLPAGQVLEAIAARQSAIDTLGKEAR